MIDKSTWGDGPWQTEPDELDWTDAATGLRCRIVRNPHMGMLCGYVGVPAKHPLFGWTSNEPAVEKLDVHGGLTFVDERDGLWWFGFDCGHGFDISPGLQAMLPPHLRSRQMGGISVVYRTIDYVHFECTNLAWQIHQLTEELSQTQSSFGGDAG
jgi:hypothetical protein